MIDIACLEKIKDLTDQSEHLKNNYLLGYTCTSIKYVWENDLVSQIMMVVFNNNHYKLLLIITLLQMTGGIKVENWKRSNWRKRYDYF